MLKVTYECDLCKRKSAEVNRGHAGARDCEDLNLNYCYSDTVNFPSGWVNIGCSAICNNCADLSKKVLTKGDR